MTRARVADDKRQRIAQACSQCQHRKQKCNGQSPCGTCAKRCIECTYAPRKASPSSLRTLNSAQPSHVQLQLQPSIALTTPHLTLPSHRLDHSHHGPIPAFESTGQGSSGAMPPAGYDATAELHEPHWARHSAEIPDIEIPIALNVRMLQDPEGRLLYTGSSAAASFLQEVRALVGATIGPCPFTMDANQHSDCEDLPQSPTNLSALPPLPDRKQAERVVDTFIANCAGCLDVIDRRALDDHLSHCYSGAPLHVSPDLCIVYLVLASGMVNLPITPTTPNALSVCSSADRFAQAELYFDAALSILGSLRGYESPQIWTVQAFALMCIFSLSVARRNAAYTFIGIAANASFSLGIHRAGDFISLMGPEQVEKRRSLWKSLAILDAFISAYMGRPPHISEEDTGFSYHYAPEDRCPPAMDDVHSQCLDYNVGVSLSIRQTLKFSYSQDMLSAGTAQSLLDYGMLLPPHDNAFFANSFSVNPLAVLRARVSQLNAIILATRPFFMHLVRLMPSTGFGAPFHVRLLTLAKNCFRAATQVIVLIHKVYEMAKLPNCDSTWIVPLFTATSVVLCNELVSLFRNTESEELVSNAMAVLDASHKTSKLVEKAWYPLASLKSIVFDQARAVASSSGPDRQRCVPVQPFKIEEGPENLHDSPGFGGQGVHLGEALDMENCYRYGPPEAPSEWSSPTDYGPSSRRHSIQSEQSGSEYMRHPSISPGLTSPFEVHWAERVPHDRVAWTQAPCILGGSQMHLPAPLMTLPSNSNSYASRYNDHISEGSNAGHHSRGQSPTSENMETEE